MHFTTVNPNSDIYGEGAVELVLEEAGSDLQALRSNQAIFQNGMNPSAVLLMDGTAKADDAKQMTAMLKQSHTGSGNQYKLVALSRTKDFKPWTLTHKDLEFLGLRNLSTTKVARGFRTPVFMFGEHNAGDFATAGVLVRETHQNVSIRLQNSGAEVITDGLTKLFNPTYCFQAQPARLLEP